jgi:hypothetical protein
MTNSQAIIDDMNGVYWIQLFECKSVVRDLKEL